MELAEKVVIRKYGNRRLYDTAASRYVNLDEVAGFIRQGKDVQVLDARTGKDLTRVVLTQIITDDARDKPGGLPLELLRQLVVASDEVRQEFVTWYLKSAFDAYQKVQSAVQSSLGDVQSAILSPVELVKRFMTTPLPTPSKTEADSELEALRIRVAELEARVQKPKRKKTGRR
jgi:polyhydroxyalkanoate synthesis repressor PhaR